MPKATNYFGRPETFALKWGFSPC